MVATVLRWLDVVLLKFIIIIPAAMGEVIE